MRGLQRTDVAIIGAGPVGLCAVLACGHLGMSATLVDALPEPGGQCAALYPEKPIYDVPGCPAIAARSLIAQLEQQIAPFAPRLLLGTRAEHLSGSSGTFAVTVSEGRVLEAAAVIIAAGAGAFGPNRPPLAGIERFEGSHVHYFVRDRARFAGQRLVIAGGGDSAVDWANDLSEIAASVTLVHRRNRFKAAPHSLRALSDKIDAGQVRVKTPYQLADLVASDTRLEAIVVADEADSREAIGADHLLAFYGIASDLGPLRGFGVALDGDQIQVDATRMETNVPGVFAIGDIAAYANKQKLIVSGFAEAFTAARMAYEHVFPGQAFHFVHSTDRAKHPPTGA